MEVQIVDDNGDHTKIDAYCRIFADEPRNEQHDPEEISAKRKERSEKE